MPSLTALEQAAETHMAPLLGSGVKGMAVGIVSGDTTWHGTFGDVPPDGIFEIGSITKTFTATAFAALVLEGKLAFDDPVQRHLPDGVTMPTHEDSRPMTLLDLATHTSGLKRLPSNLLAGDFNPRNPYAHFDEKLLLEAIPDSELDGPPGVNVSYSNYGFGLLGYLLGRIAGTEFDSIVDQVICGPLGMKETYLSVPAELQTRRVQGHSQAGGPVPHWDMPGAIAGCGGINSTITDMLIYLKANLFSDEVALDRAIESAHSPRVRVSDRHSVALGWHIRHEGGPHLVWHNGGTGGFGSMLVFDRESRVGAVVLSNSYHHDKLDGRVVELITQLRDEKI